VVTVYNLEVDGDHTYFVGDDVWGFDVWVHNANRYRGTVAGGAAPREGRGIPKKGPHRPRWGNAPETGGLKGHAQKHGGEEGVPRHPQAYYDQAVDNMNHGRKVPYTHGGQVKTGYVTKIGDDQYLFTGTSKNNQTIFTHMSVQGKYLGNLGIRPW
jgi:hypothetical protein